MYLLCQNLYYTCIYDICNAPFNILTKVVNFGFNLYSKEITNDDDYMN